MTGQGVVLRLLIHTRLPSYRQRSFFEPDSNTSFQKASMVFLSCRLISICVIIVPVSTLLYTVFKPGSAINMAETLADKNQNYWK